MIGERARQPGESDESWTAHCSLVATLSLRAILATPEGREALKALLTEDGPTEAAKRATCGSLSPGWARAALAAAVDALDSVSSEGEPMGECDHDWKVQSMRRNGTWVDAPSYPLAWVGRRPSVRAVCRRCGAITVDALDSPEGDA